MKNYDLTRTNRNRLAKLADKLESLPLRYKHFNMNIYIDYTNLQAARVYAQKNGGVNQCGTVACALGHGPAAGVFFPKTMIGDRYRFDFDSAGLDWRGYATLFIGDKTNQDPIWHWLFGGAWEGCDNHHYGAAARIRYVLADLPLPEAFLKSVARHPSTFRRQHRAAYRSFDKRYA
jgi:hypothetical protein